MEGGESQSPLFLSKLQILNCTKEGISNTKGNRMFDHKIEAKQFFIDTGKTNSKGKPITVRIVIQTLYLNGEKPELFSNAKKTSVQSRRIKVVRTVRRGNVSYSISAIPEAAKQRWTTAALKLQPDETVTWKRLESLNEQDFAKWLLYRVANPAAVLAQFVNAMPLAA